MPLINWNEATVDDLHGFTTDFIRHELSRGNLETTGSNDEMIERLLADIAHNPSQLLQANKLKAKKRPDAKASLDSAALDCASSLYDLRQQLSHKIEALRGKRAAGSEHKADKQAVKPTAKPTENKRHKPSQDSPAAASNKKAGKAPQPAAAFNRDSHVIYSKFELADSSLGTDARPKLAEKKVVRQLEVNVEKMKTLRNMTRDDV
ncbi:hypothetical protein HPB52_005272 [Rhipicephalus sanguineus]|uniref:Uncharacterized protein n=1 Tax=Rhipicephalus sanguineus TaxID=34632 RepID=A0A9D4QHD6_RHISA|nr:hypothetical protein HPB52_005272 [Rhipicephalus sanguineus]